MGEIEYNTEVEFKMRKILTVLLSALLFMNSVVLPVRADDEANGTSEDVVVEVEENSESSEESSDNTENELSEQSSEEISDGEISDDGESIPSENEQDGDLVDSEQTDLEIEDVQEENSIEDVEESVEEELSEETDEPVEEHEIYTGKIYSVDDIVSVEDDETLGYREIDIDEENLLPPVKTPSLLMSTVNQNVSIPARYDLRDYGYVSSVKNQGSYNTCWAHATMAAAESNYLMKYGKELDLSEYQLAYFMYNNIGVEDQLNLVTNEGLGNNQEFSPLQGGGNNLVAEWMMSSGIGFVTEENMPYPSFYSGGINVNAINKDYCYKLNSYYLTEANSYSNKDFTDIKRTILQRGAIAASYYHVISSASTNDGTIFYNSQFYNKDTYAYYNYAIEGTNHAITIVGWDDNFSRENFVKDPGEDGAWLIKNSWGTSFADGGYMWISYKDLGYNSSDSVVSFEIEPTNNDVYLYQLEASYGFNYRWRQTSGKIGNIYTAQDYEAITSIGYQTARAGTNSTIEIYGGVTSRPDDGTLLATVSAYDSYMGFHTVKLDEAIFIEKGEKFGVVIKETHPENLSFITIKSGTFGWMEIADITEPGQSFISEQYNDKVWKDLYDYKETAPIKVFTSRKAEFHVNYANTKGAVNNNATVYTFGENNGSISLSNLSLAGYTFNGWYTDDSYTTKVTSINTLKPKNITLYAKWTPTQYNITYALNGGSVSGNPSKYNIETPTFTLKNPVKLGYTFTGWTGSNGNNPSLSVRIAMGTTGNKSYTANWTELNDGIVKYVTPAYITTQFSDRTGIRWSQTGLASTESTDVTGYTFDGWYIDNTYKTKYSNQSYGTLINGDATKKFITLYGKWNIINYSINYNLNGGSISGTNPTTYNVTTNTFTLKNPSRKGYDFTGWTGSNGTIPSTNVTIIKGSSGNRTYTANWDEFDSGIVDYVLDTYEGMRNVPKDIDNLTGVKWTDKKLIPSTNPSVLGYNFVGWFTDAKLTVPFDANKTYGAYVENIDGFKPLVLYAKWEPQTLTYTVIHRRQNIDGSYPSSGNFYVVKTYQAKTDAALRPAVETYTGFTSPAVSTVYNEANYVGGTVKGPTIVYDYTRNTYHLTINNTDKFETINYKSEYKYNEAVNISFTLKKGYQLTAWEGNQTTPQFNFPAYDVTMTPKISIIKYSISYMDCVSLGGSHSNPLSYTVEDQKIILKDAERLGYEFLGWFDSNGNRVTEIDTAEVRNITLYAHWQIITYHITYNLGRKGEIPNGANNPTEYTVESEDITLINPVWNGASFLGWKESENASAVSNVTIPKGSVGDRTYIARYLFPKYAITYDIGSDVTLPNWAPTSYTVENEIMLPIPTRGGYNFSGWVVRKTLGGETVSKFTVDIAQPVTLTPIWDVATYSITYILTDDNGISGNLETAGLRSYQITYKDFYLPNVICNVPGYEFIGWIGTDLDEITKPVLIAEGSYGNRTYIANYAPIEYDINYYIDDDVTLIGNNYSRSYNLLSNPVLPMAEKPWYDFEYWTYEDGTKVEGFDVNLLRDVTLKPKWKPKEYSISYLDDNGNILNVNAPRTFNIEFTNFSIGNPSNIEGKTFVGWTGPGIGDTPKINPIISVSKFTTPGAVTYVAHYEYIKYPITYTLDGGTLGENSPTYYTIETDVVSLVPATKRGHEFIGWFDDSTGNIITEINTSKKKEVRLSASWTEKYYNITYDLNGGNANSGNNTQYTVNTETFMLNNPWKVGYEFIGWTGTELSQPTMSVSVPKGSIGDRKYIANYKINVYKIGYNLNGGTLPENAPKEYTVEDSVTLPTPTKRGYIFKGWSGSGLEPTMNVSFGPGRAGHITFVANWEIENYTIEYDLSGGTLLEENPTTYNVETETFTLNNPVMDGVNFVGWVAEGSSLVIPKVTIEKGSIGNRRYTALFRDPMIIFNSSDIAYHKLVDVDGQKVSVDENMMTPLGENSKYASAYIIKNMENSDIHTQYPTSMMVFRLDRAENGFDKNAVRLPYFDEMLNYAGTSIRLTGSNGIRVITKMNATVRSSLMSEEGYNGWNVVEYGTLMGWKSSLHGQEPTLEMVGNGIVKGRAYSKEDNIDAVFAQSGNMISYTNTLVGNYTDEQCDQDFAIRSYMIVRPVGATDDSQDMTIYGGTLYRSISYVAYQNKDVYSSGSNGYKYIQSLLGSYRDN